MSRLLSRIFPVLLSAFVCAAGTSRAQTPWVKSVKHQQTAYFLFDSRIERFDMASQSWQPAVSLPASGAKSIVASDRGVFVAIGTDIHRFDADLGNRTILTTTGQPVVDLLLDGDMLIATQTGSGITVLFRPLAGGSPVLSNLTSSTWNLPAGASVATVANKLFARSTRGPLDIVQATYQPAGGLITVNDSPYGGSDFPVGTRTSIMPGETRVVDDAGIAYSTADLTYAGSFGGPFHDIAFRESDSLPVVLRGNRLGLHDALYRETSIATLSGSAASVHLTGDAAFAFLTETSARGVKAERVPFTAFAPAAIPVAANPEGLAYTADQIMIDRDGIVLVYSSAQKTVFRWSPAGQRYLDGIGLGFSPVQVTYSPGEHALYLGSSTGAISRVSAEPGAPVTAFANLPTIPRGLIAADPYLVAIHQQGSGNVHSSFDATGTLVETKDSVSTSQVYEYSPGTRRFYWFNDRTTAGRIYHAVIGADGRFGPNLESPYVKPVIRDTPPIRANASGSRFAIARGIIFGGPDLEVVYEMERTSSDLGWLDETLFGIEPLASANTTVNRWTADWNVDRTRAVEGSPLRIFPGATRSLVVTQFNGRPRFYELDENLDLVTDSVAGRVPVISAQPDSTRTDYGGSASFRVLALGSGPFIYRWTKDGELLPDANSADLVLGPCGSASAGTYQVTVSNAAGSVNSATARLGVGPIRNSPLTAGNLLVCSGDRFHEARTNGQIVRSMQVPNPYASGFSHRVEDAVMDSLGRVHVMFKSFAGGFEPATIGTYDPEFDSWTHVRLWESFSPNSQELDLSLAGHTLITNRMVTVDLRNGHTQRMPPIYNSFDRPSLTAGLDGFAYGTEANGVIVRFHPESWERLQTTIAAPTLRLPGATAAANGTIFGFTNDRRLGRFAPGSNNAGSYLSLSSLPNSTYFDINLSKSGQLALGTGSQGVVVLSSTALQSATAVTMAGVTGGVYAGWVEAPVIPAPAFAATPPATTPEDAPFLLDPAPAHADPDQVLALTLEAGPPWLRLDEQGRLAGTPLDEHIGTSPVRLKATDSFGVSSTLAFDLEVLEVNDLPLAVDFEITRDEDVPPFRIALGSLFSDEETEDDALIHEILFNDNPALASARIASGTILFSPVKDAFGTMRVTVRATDQGGLSADSEIHITLTPVNDPPVFATDVPDLTADADGASRSLELSAFIFDADPGDVLTWSLETVTLPAIFSRLVVDPATGKLDIDFAPFVSGSSDVTVRATDGSGTSAAFTFRITLPDLPLPALSVASTIALNRQTGLMEQRITVTNTAARDIAGFDLAITGLPDGVSVQNATNAGNGTWYLQHRKVMTPGASVDFTVEYKLATRGTIFEPRISVSLVTVPEAPAAADQPGLAVSRCEHLPDGGLLIEFISVPGRAYEVQYSDDALTWIKSPVEIIAASNRVQWIDRGPPRTDSPPANEKSRFYRVRELGEVP